jgi:hypothetical protein
MYLRNAEAIELAKYILDYRNYQMVPIAEQQQDYMINEHSKYIGDDTVLQLFINDRLPDNMLGLRCSEDIDYQGGYTTNIMYMSKREAVNWANYTLYVLEKK